jgi:PAS domain S-box-containing protein
VARIESTVAAHATGDAVASPEDDLQRKVVERTSQLEAANAQLQARNRQQSALAALGQTAIRCHDLAALLQEATEVAAKTVGTELAGTFEWLADAKRFRLIAGVGWKDGTIGRTVADDPASMAAYVLRSPSPVAIDDVRTESRFAVFPDALAHGVVSAMGVSIGSLARPWGCLTLYTTRARSFTSDEVGFLLSVASVLALAIDRHAADMARQRETEMLQTVYDNIPVMISVFGGGQLLRVNGEWERTLGWTLEETREVDILAESYPDPERRREAIEFIRRAERHWGDFQMRTRDGRPVEVSWARFALSDGSSIGFGLDITDRKRAEEALRESEMRFRQALENINAVFWLWNVEGPNVLYVNSAYEEVFGRTRESVYREPRSWLEGVHPEDRERVRRAADEMRVRGSMEETYRVLRPDGSIRWVRDRSFAIRNRAGEIHRFAAVAEDITDRKEAEDERTQLLARETRARTEAEGALARLRAIDTITDSALVHLGLDDLLHELLVRLRRTLAADSVGVQLVDEDGQTLYNRAVDGYTHPQFSAIRVRIGTGVTGRIAAEGRPMVVDDYSTVDTSGITGIPATQIRARTQSVMGAPLRIGDKVVGVVSVISERPRHFTEEELRLLLLVADRAAPAVELARLLEKLRAAGLLQRTLSRRLLTAQEEERRRLAVELHDELGQVLTAVKINLGSLERLSGATPSPSHLQEAIASVDRAMQSVRDLALDLRPSVLDDFGLPAALRWYVDRFARATNIDAHLAVDDVARLEPELETACFRVAQEALTNVARHAQARRVWLCLHLRREELELSVRDDGIGFDAGAARERAGAGGSMGLLGMQERVSLLGGDLEILRPLAGGAEVRARFALAERPRETP